MAHISKTFIALFRLSPLLAFFFNAESFGNFHPNIIRGGQGLIFADANSLINPGENALNHGLSLETLGEYRKTSTGSSYLVGPSANLATYGFNIGGYYQCAGTSPGEKDEFESFAASFGTHFLFRRLTAGVTYSRVTTTTTQEATANLYGTMTAHFGKRDPYHGLLIAGSVNQQLGVTLATTAYSLGVGYGINRHSGYEFNMTLHDIYNASDWSLGAYYTKKNQQYYWAGGLAFSNIRSAKFSGRIGWLYKHFDASIYTNLPFSSAQTIQVGLSVRQVY